MQIRPATPSDFPAVLALNAESVHFLSPMNDERLAMLADEAEAHWVVAHAGRVCAFLIAFREDATYDSVNYRWFCLNYPKFLYIDRVVVSSETQGRGFGAALYKAVFARAQSSAVPVVTCEFDIDPPNPISANFHAKYRFSEVGRQIVANGTSGTKGTKTVSLQAAHVGDPLCGAGSP